MRGKQIEMRYFREILRLEGDGGQQPRDFGMPGRTHPGIAGRTAPESATTSTGSAWRVTSRSTTFWPSRRASTASTFSGGT